jgi:hypothetical protein
MAKIERIREVLSRPFDEGYFRTKLKEGWRLVAVQWEREVEGDALGQAPWIEEVPYGLRVADDCLHLEENPVERRTLELMLKLISSDKSMSQMPRNSIAKVVALGLELLGLRPLYLTCCPA